jgi:hypothetical protein
MIVATIGVDSTSSRALAMTRGACSPFGRRAAGRSKEALWEEICAQELHGALHTEVNAVLPIGLDES